MNPPAPRLSQELTHDLVAEATGRGYRLKIWTPPDPAPPGGWPVLWVLDGLGYHGLATDAVRNLGTLGGEFTPALVVSVTYPTDDMAVCLARRFQDFTATPPAPGPLAQVLHGGIEPFLDMLQAQALPFVAGRFAIDRERMALVGHSMGGVAVLHALFTRPAMFQSWLALSPSIHWGGCAVLAHEASFAARLLSAHSAPRVFIAVGGLEQSVPAAQAAGLSPEALAALDAHVGALRMVDNAAALAARLQALQGAPGCRVQWQCPPDDSHMSLPFTVFRQALVLAFGPAP